MLFFHNIKSSWRNLMKYKVQNAISILCLSVGIVCFAAMVQIVRAMAIKTYLDTMDTSVAELSFSYKSVNGSASDNGTGQENPYYPTNAFINRLNALNLPAIKEVIIAKNEVNADLRFEVDSAVVKTFRGNFENCSPHYFHRNLYRSALTGKRMPALRKGDVVITDDIRDRVFGKHADPRGRIFLTGQNERMVITDVVNITERVQECIYPGVFRCQTTLPDSEYRGDRFVTILLNEGFTPEELQKQVAGAITEYHCEVHPKMFVWSGSNVSDLFLMLLYALLGASVLVIGVSGFLRTELQLFSLRSREMALRRTMGAKPSHLFALLGTEVVLVFLFCTALAHIISVHAVDHVLYIMRGFTPWWKFNTSLLHTYIIITSGVTLLFTLLVAWFSVRCQVHTPLGLRVGKSHPLNGRHGFWLCVQFAAGILFTFIVVATYIFIYTTEQKAEREKMFDAHAFKNAMQIDFFNYIKVLNFHEKIKQLDHLAHFSYITSVPKKDKAFAYAPLTQNMPERGKDGNYFFSYHRSDEFVFDHLNISIVSEEPDDKERAKRMTRVLVPAEDLQRLQDKWGVQAGIHNAICFMVEGKQYHFIGYAPYMEGLSYSNEGSPIFWIVDNEMPVLEWTMEYFTKQPHPTYYVFPKKGKYNDTEKALQKMFADAEPNNTTLQGVRRLYDIYFVELLVYSLVRRLSLLLLLVSVICIVASVYSAISLECRGREKEVALRKIHGAKVWDIMCLFGRYYLRLLIVATIFTIVLLAPIIVIIYHITNIQFTFETIALPVLFFLCCALAVGVVVLLTVARNIYKVSHLNPADVIKKNN